MSSVYEYISNKLLHNEKMFAVLVDPDGYTDKDKLLKLSILINTNAVDLILVGGSIIQDGDLNFTVKFLKQNCSIPVVIFPGSYHQVVESADAILFLSLISGRNPEFLIGQQVLSAPLIKQMNIETIATGYMLIDTGKESSVSLASNTTPIPANEIESAVATAMAGEMLGMKIIYAEGGSGAINSISENMIKSIKKAIRIPLAVGGGLKNAEDVLNKLTAGADIIVVGNAIESNPDLVSELSACVELFNKSKVN